jgi:flagellin
MRELAVQAASGTMSTTDRAALHVEFKNLSGQIQNIGSNTQWNGSNILDGTPGSASFQVGANASQTVSHTFSQIKTAIASGSTPAVAATTDADGTDEEKFTVTLDDGATFAAGDTLTFKVDSIFYSANIDAVDSDGDVSAITFHGASTQITEAGTENYVVHTVTSDANGATTSPAGDVKVNISGDNVFTFEGSLAHADADFTVLMTSELNDGTALANSTASTGLVAGAMFADISTVKGANSALHTIDHGIDRINTARSTSGATINRLEYAADNLANVSQNTSASRSRILDADYASETTELARTQIIQQAATAMLSQANQQAQSVLALLK